MKEANPDRILRRKDKELWPEVQEILSSAIRARNFKRQPLTAHKEILALEKERARYSSDMTRTSQRERLAGLLRTKIDDLTEDIDSVRSAIPEQEKERNALVAQMLLRDAEKLVTALRDRVGTYGVTVDPLRAHVNAMDDVRRKAADRTPWRLSRMLGLKGSVPAATPA